MRILKDYQDQITLSEIKVILKKSVESLFTSQQNIFKFTSETRQTEWSLAHHLANEIHKFFPKLNCDLDVVKINLNRKRPDIIFHDRDSHNLNILVVEVKKDGTDNEREEDIKKVKSSWFIDPLRYKFGAVVNLKSNKTWDVKVFENDKETNP